MKVVLDASVIVARFVPSDVAHDDSLLVVRACGTNEISAVEPLLLLPEVAGAISRKTGKENLASVAILHLRSYSWLRIRVSDRIQLADKAARLAARHALRGADAVYLALAIDQKCPLVTLDEELPARAPVGAKVMRPAQWLAMIQR